MNLSYILLAECIRSGQCSAEQINKHLEDAAFAEWFLNNS